MRITQQFTVAHPLGAVWDLFGDIDTVTVCMPGASLREPAAGQHAKFVLRVKLGPIRAAFEGESDLERDAASHRGVIRGSGRDQRTGSRAKGEVEYVLSPAADGAATRVDIRVDYSLAGPLAQFSRGGIVNDLAARLTADFAKHLEAKLDTLAGASPDPSGGGSPAPTRAAPSADAPRELAAGTLLISVLWTRIKRFVRTLLGR